eukprot:21567-Heterococcus_DN1.PRE.4
MSYSVASFESTLWHIYCTSKHPLYTSARCKAKLSNSACSYAHAVTRGGSGSYSSSASPSANEL